MMEFCIAFAFWLMMVLVVGFGIYRAWAYLLGVKVADFILLPATIVSELAYSAGNLLCGRPAAAGLIARDRSYRGPMQVPTGRGGFGVSMFSAFLSLIVGFGVLVLIVNWIGTAFLESLAVRSPNGGIMKTIGDGFSQGLAWAGVSAADTLPKKLPTSGAELSDMFKFQWELIGRMWTAWGSQDWATWQSPLFFYLAAAFCIRLGMTRHDWRAAMLVNLIVCGMLLLTQLIWSDLKTELMFKPWILLTYIWGTMLYLIMLTGVIFIIRSIVRLIRGKSPVAAG